MDDRLEKMHDFRDTIREAAEIESDGKQEAEREQRLNEETAYTALAITAAMGNNGFDANTANLLELEMAQEMLYLFDPENGEEQERDKMD